MKRYSSPEYYCWNNIRQRCTLPHHPSYKNYGARGIRLCDEWINDFKAFLSHVGPRPGPKHTIDRIDNDRGYEPGNVRWTTRAINQRNRRATKLRADIVECVRWWRGRGLTPSDWGFVFGVSPSLITNIIAGRKWATA